MQTLSLKTRLLLTSALAALSATSGCGFASGLGSAIGEAVGKGIVCGTVGSLEDPGGSVRDMGTAAAVYVIRDDHDPAPLLLGTSGQVRIVGIMTPTQVKAGDDVSVSITKLQSAPNEQCWAEGTIDALGVGSARVDVTSGEARVSAEVEVAEAARFELDDGFSKIDPSEELVLGVGESRELVFRVLDEQARDLAFLEPLRWRLPMDEGIAAVMSKPEAGAADTKRVEGQIVTLVAERVGTTALTLTFGNNEVAFSVRVQEVEPTLDAGAGITDVDAQADLDAGSDAGLRDQ